MWLPPIMSPFGGLIYKVQLCSEGIHKGGFQLVKDLYQISDLLGVNELSQLFSTYMLKNLIQIF